MANQVSLEGAEKSAQPAQQTDWSEEQVRRFLEEEHFGYQRIELPYGLFTGGEDRSQTAAQIFPADMKGKSVLDIGSSHGYFCFEALRRGASRAMGVDVDPENIRKARRLADCLGLPAEFDLLDIDQDEIGEQFDYVLGLNLLHHVKNPISALDKLIGATRERLILEMAGLGRHERRKLRLGARGLFLAKSPVIVVGRQGAKHFGEQRFFITPQALQNFLLYQRRVFATATTNRSGFKNRFLTIAEKRQIENLLVVAGPTSVGKDHFIEKLSAGELPEISRALGIDDVSTWQVMRPRHLKHEIGAKTQRLLFHYDFLRPYLRSAKTHSRDEALNILQVANNLTFVTLVAPPDVLRDRIEKGEIQPRMSGGEYKGSSRHLKLRQDYEDPNRVRYLYEGWLEFSKKWSKQHLLVSYGDDISVADIDDWETVAQENGL